MRRTLTILLAGAVAGCSGNGDGGLGDLPSTPRADPLGGGARIAELLGPATWLDDGDMDSASCSSPAEKSVYVTGSTIVAIDRYDETGDGAVGNFYVEDTSQTPVPYSGVTVFDPSFSPPDLRLAAGDVVDTQGLLSEFLGPSSGRFGFCKTLPEIGGTLTFRFENGAVTPVTVPLADLKSYATARQWLGMLIRVENIRIANPPANSGGRYTADIDVGAGVQQQDVPKLSNELFDLQTEGPPIAEGTMLGAVTGILTYFYGFKIAPRSAADVEP